jgi:hypothetical protein
MSDRSGCGSIGIEAPLLVLDAQVAIAAEIEP